MEIVDGRRRTDDGAWYPISSLFEPKGSCELKIGIPMHTKVLLYKSVVHGVFTGPHVILIWITDHARDDLKYVKTLQGVE